MSRLERLLNLTAALLSSSRPMTAEEIHRTIPGYPDDKLSFKRQFERDKDALRGLGMPIEQSTAGAVTGYRITPDGYYLRDPGLAPDELRALQLAARTVALEGFPSTDGLWKLGTDGRTQPGARPPSTSTVPFATAEVPTSAVLPALFDAITDSRIARFAYRGEQRRTLPRALSFRNGHWYLDAHDLDRADDRSFRVDRITGDVTLGEVGDRPPSARAPGRSAMPWELGDGPVVRARVLVDAHQAPWAVRHLGDAAVDERRPDGSVVVHLDVVNVDAFVSFVVGFLADAEVLGPPELRTTVVQWLAPIADGSR